MKAALIRETGPAENIRIENWSVGAPKANEVRVAVSATSVNPIDTYIRAGIVKMPIPIPYVVGCDLAGKVEAVGAEVDGFKVGDRVWGSNQGLMGRQGSSAESVCIESKWLYRSPDGVGDVELAASALTSITAHLGLFGKAGLKAGETIYVSGGAGGVGSMVVQMAKAIGAKVIASAGGPDKSAYVRSIGADEVIDYKSENLKSALERSAPNGVDIWWDTVREPDFELAVARLAPRGRIVVMAGREAKPTFPIGPFYTRDCSLFGFAMFNADAETQAKSALEINHLFSSGKLKANVGVVLPLEKAAEAHALQEANTLRQEGTLRGKIVLKLA